MSLTVNAKTFTQDNVVNNGVTYAGPANTVTSKDLLALRRVAPKPTSVFSGVGRTSAKLTRTQTLTGALTPFGDMIIEMSVSCPVGAADADVEAALDDAAAFLGSADCKNLVKKQQVLF